MTRPKVPTIAELRKAARKALGQGARVVEAPPFGIGHEFVLTAWAGDSESDEINVSRLIRTEARKRMAEILAALPSAPAPKKRKGAKR